jgi:Zn-dependent alcohol dehydrogenase
MEITAAVLRATDGSYGLEGSVVPRELVPRLLELWWAGRFPFDRLIETFPSTRSTTPRPHPSQGSW